MEESCGRRSFRIETNLRSGPSFPGYSSTVLDKSPSLLGYYKTHNVSPLETVVSVSIFYLLSLPSSQSRFYECFLSLCFLWIETLTPGWKKSSKDSGNKWIIPGPGSVWNLKRFTRPHPSFLKQQKWTAWQVSHLLSCRQVLQAVSGYSSPELLPRLGADFLTIQTLSPCSYRNPLPRIMHKFPTNPLIH